MLCVKLIHVWLSSCICFFTADCLMTVHDCAARLPNGEGTRNDICELLKDSQFLAPGVTDTQVSSSELCYK